MRTIELSNGAVMPCDWCGEAEGVLTFNLVECQSVAEAVAALDEAEATEYVVFHYGEDEARHDGPWVLRSVALNGWPTGGVLVSMTRM